MTWYISIAFYVWIAACLLTSLFCIVVIRKHIKAPSIRLRKFKAFDEEAIFGSLEGTLSAEVRDLNARAGK